MMRFTLKMMSLTSALLLGGVLSFAHLGASESQDETRTVKSARGGNLAKTARYQFEVFYFATGVRVFPMDSAGSPIETTKLTGIATFYHPNSPKPWFSRPLQGSTLPGQASVSLDHVIDLRTIPPTGAKVTFEIAGLPDSAASTATLTVPFEFFKTPTESAATNPTPPPTGVAPSPRYVYGPGYYGYGYYQYPGPQTAPAQMRGPTIYDYGRPSQHNSSGGTVGAGHRDWSTGRDNGLAKPWMKSMD